MAKKIKHRIVDELVQQIDIMPTILDMLGLPPSEGLQGYSLLPSIQGNPANNLRPVFCETILGGYQSTKEMEEIRLRCVRTKEWKLIYTKTPTSNVSSGGLDDGKYELYNLSSAPKEERNIFENHPEVAKELKKNSFSGSKQLRQKNIVLSLMQELIRFNRDEKKTG